MIDFGTWRNAVTDLPEKDGDYIIIRFYKKEFSHASSVHYTVAHGWNTHLTSFGHAMDYDDEDYITLWSCGPVVDNDFLNKISGEQNDVE